MRTGSRTSALAGLLRTDFGKREPFRSWVSALHQKSEVLKMNPKRLSILLTCFVAIVGSNSACNFVYEEPPQTELRALKFIVDLQSSEGRFHDRHRRYGKFDEMAKEEQEPFGNRLSQAATSAYDGYIFQLQPDQDHYTAGTMG
jgi:hypothetical protein